MTNPLLRSLLMAQTISLSGEIILIFMGQG
jgi:hypothetical protein